MPSAVPLLNIMILLILFISIHNINIIQLSDIHYDPLFKPKSSIYTFCHRNSAINGDELANSLWGRECDSSGILILQTLKHISQRHDDISFIFLTGDNSRHDDDDEIPKSRDEIIWSNIKLKSWLKEYFPNVPVIFSLGNNDVYVHDSLIAGPNMDFKSLANIWLIDYPETETKTFEFGGYWSTWISENLKVISLNTLYFFKNNFLAKSCDSETSPGKIQIDWLKSELDSTWRQDASVIIIGHVPPINIFYHEDCLKELMSVFAEYSSKLIINQLYGHIHLDDFFILKHEGIPVGSALASPAISPVFNPSYRIYEFHKDNGSLLDYHQYYSELRNEALNFFREYSFKEAFGNGPLDLEYFINLDLREKKSSSLRIKRKRYKFVKY